MLAAIGRERRDIGELGLLTRPAGAVELDRPAVELTDRGRRAGSSPRARPRGGRGRRAAACRPRSRSAPGCAMRWRRMLSTGCGGGGCSWPGGAAPARARAGRPAPRPAPNATAASRHQCPAAHRTQLAASVSASRWLAWRASRVHRAPCTARRRLARPNVNRDRRAALNGEVAEWFKAAVLKTAVGASPPWVRIPPSPPPSKSCNGGIAATPLRSLACCRFIPALYATDANVQTARNEQSGHRVAPCCVYEGTCPSLPPSGEPAQGVSVGAASRPIDGKQCTSISNRPSSPR